ncbi:MAG TPA: YceI family protein [Burkholderiaceae bacterium]|nr:YceI family protein [Burkholderiaceae bacterium]
MAAAATVLLVSAVAWAQAPAAPGSISIVGKQMGAPVEGQFKKFTAQIQFDPANPAASKAAVEIDVASIDLGLEDFNQELRTKTWFDAKGHPTATFVSSAIKPLAPDRLELSGKLTIKGKTKDVTFPVTIKTEGQTRVFTGTLPIRRNDFGVGEGGWKDTSVVADEVQIRFRVAAASK